MNIFWLDFDPTKCAQYHADRHVLKMIIELAQLLCTAHRILDGTMIEEEYVTKTNKKRKRKVYKLDDEHIDMQLYKATHVNHPCAKWVRECDKNYEATYRLFVALCHEYTHRYEKTHKCYTLFNGVLAVPPASIPKADTMTSPALAMPDECKVESVVESYRKYYKSDGKKSIVTWTKNRPVPDWF